MRPAKALDMMGKAKDEDMTSIAELGNIAVNAGSSTEKAGRILYNSLVSLDFSAETVMVFHLCLHCNFILL